MARWILRFILLLILIAGGWFIFQGHPQPARFDVPMGNGGGDYYTEGVWLGVAKVGDFSTSGFTLGPAIVVTPTRAGWKGDFEFDLGGIGKPEHDGEFVIILPKQSSLTIPSGSGLTLSTDESFSRKLYHIKITAALSDTAELEARFHCPGTPPT